MNAVKTSVLVLVVCLLFVAVPCYAAESVPYMQTHELSLTTIGKDNADNVLGHLEQIGNGTSLGNTSGTVPTAVPVYSIVAGVSNPTINPGESVKIIVYLSGYGIPGKCKLQVIWPYVGVIDAAEGNITSLEYYVSDGNVVGVRPSPIPLALGNTTGSSGAWFVPANATFWNVPQSMQSNIPDTGIRMINGEFTWNGYAPISIELKTEDKAKPGDYQIGLTFTYGNETDKKQDSKTVEFHIRSMLWHWPTDTWELYGAIIGGVIAWFALTGSFLGRIFGRIIRGISLGVRRLKELCRGSRKRREEEKRKNDKKRSR